MRWLATAFLPAPRRIAAAPSSSTAARRAEAAGLREQAPALQNVARLPQAAARRCDKPDRDHLAEENSAPPWIPQTGRGRSECNPRMATGPPRVSGCSHGLLRPMKSTRPKLRAKRGWRHAESIVFLAWIVKKDGCPTGASVWGGSRGPEDSRLCERLSRLTPSPPQAACAAGAVGNAAMFAPAVVGWDEPAGVGPVVVLPFVRGRCAKRRLRRPIEASRPSTFPRRLRMW